MKLAIPEHQGRVAPVFDCCRKMLVVVQNPMGEELVDTFDWSALPREARPKSLSDLLVEVLVCGGITCSMEEQVRRHGVRVIPWVAGEIWDVLSALREGRLSDGCYRMPGRGRCRRRCAAKKWKNKTEQPEDQRKKGA